MENKHPKFVRWALLVGIVVILNIFFGVLTSLALPAPDYNTYCPSNVSTTLTASACDSAGGVWTENAPAPLPAKGAAPATTGYCDLYAKCQPLYQAASDQHNLYAFVLMVGLGILALIIGFVPIGSSIVSSGLSYGGVIAFVIASAQYWGTAGEWIRLLIAAIGLGALVWIGWKRFRD